MSRRSSHRSPSKGPSQRQLRVAEEIRHLLAEILGRGRFRDPVLASASVTITEVRISPDLKNATAFCVPLGGTKSEEIIAALNKAQAYLRGQVGQRLALRYAPELSFAPDTTFEEVARIDRLLQSEKVKRDLKLDKDAGDDDET